MNHTSAGLLEFDRLKELLGRYVSSPLGRRELEQVAPLAQRPAVEALLAETSEAIEYLETAARPQPAARGAAVRLRFSGLTDPNEALAKLRIEGAALEPKELFALTGLLDRTAEIRAVLVAVGQRFPKLAARGAALGEFRHLVADLAGKILPDGTVADHASPVLNRLRRDLERQQRLIQESLERFLRVHREDGVLQEEYVAIRNERFVVPVVAGQQRRIEGVVHSASGTGHTLFVEPLETIQLNNELVRLHEEEQAEVRRILLELSDHLRQYLDAIARSVALLGELELVFAKASFAAEFGCTVPRFSPPEARRLALRDARHPLLEDVLRRRRRPVVPASLELGGGTRTLLVSGPNSGGKTVTLKTVGLLALMAQAGLPVPCGEAEFPFFDQVLADMGDNQSIQESLSTFSAHITRIREMVTHVTPDSLVLPDELGRATDPEEGGALGVAILDRFRASGAFTVASTHLLALKLYGAATAGVLNGSMGFDEHTLQPTYVLRLGAPGKSAGLDIATRLGLPADLLEAARARLGSREHDVSRFLSELDQRLSDTARLQADLQRDQEKLAARERSLAADYQRREAAKIAELERRCDLVLQKFEAEARQVIEGLVAGAEQKKAQRGVARVKRELREDFDVAILSTRSEARQGELRPPDLAAGTRVRLRGVRQIGRVRRVIDEDLLEVEVGVLKLQVSRGDVLEVLPETDAGPRLPSGVSFRGQTELSPTEINVIGQHAEEAIEHVDKFLDNAVLAGVTRVRIVHGFGMGVLRRAVGELLAKNPNVEKFYPAPPSEGGAGATIVELKE